MSQNPDPCTMVNECHDEILDFVTLCASKKEFNFQFIHPKTLSEKLKRGGVLNIIVCGTAKSGKSTLVNYLLSSGPNDMEDESKHILPTGKEIRTVAPWIIQDTVDLPPGKISVEHVNHHGKVGGQRTFDTIPELHRHLKEAYSKKHVMDELRSQEHYIQIRLSFGRPNSKLNQGLFSSAVTIIDTQDLSNPEVGAMIKAMQGPCILICCFDFSKDFDKELCTFKNIISSLPKTHVMFACTHAEVKLCNMQKAKFRANKCNLNYNALLEELKKEVVDLLTTESFSIPDEVFYFDPSSKHEPICSSVYKLQERLIALRKDLNIDLYFCQEMKHLLKNEVVAIRDELSIAGQKLFESAIEKRSRAKAEKFVEKFENKLNDSLEEEILKLAKERKSEFMKDRPKGFELQRKMLNWLSKEALEAVIVLVLKSMPQENFDLQSSTPLGNVQPFPIEFVQIVAQIVGNLVGFNYGAMVGGLYKLIRRYTTPANFKTDGLDFLKTVIQKIKEEGLLEPTLEKIIDVITSQLLMEVKIQLTVFPPRIMEYIQKNLDIDCEKLEKIEKVLDSIN